MTLRSLQATANNQGSQAPMTWRALNAAFGGFGAPSITYQGFAAQWDAEESLPPEQQTLHNLVDRFDGHGVVIKTQEEDLPVKGKEGHEVEKMAKRATKLGK